MTVVAVALFGLVAVAGIASTNDPGGTPAATAFRLEDASAGCTFLDGELACRAEGQAAAAVLSADGSSHVGSGELVSWDESTPVLLASESWWHGSFRCRVVAAVVHCSAGDGGIAAGSGGVGGIR